MKRLVALLILTPWVTWMTIIWSFFFVLFVTPVVLCTILEWLCQMAKGKNQTFCESWMLAWKDSLAQGTLQQIRNPI